MTNSIEITYPEALHKLADWVEANAETISATGVDGKVRLHADIDDLAFFAWSAQEERPTIVEDLKAALGLEFSKPQTNGGPGSTYITRSKTNLFGFFNVTIFFKVSA